MSILIVSLDSFAICNLCPSLSQETCFVLHFYDVIIRCRKYTAIRECSNTVYVYRNVKRICTPTVEKYRSRILWKAIKHHQKTLKLETISKYAWEDIEYIVLLQSRGWLLCQVLSSPVFTHCFFVKRELVVCLVPADTVAFTQNSAFACLRLK